MAPDPLPIPRYTRFYDRSATTERIYPRLTRTERAGGGRQEGGQRAGDRVYLAKAIRRRDHRERRRSDEGKSREHSGVYAQTGDHLVIRGLGSFFCPTSDEREEGKVAAAATAAAVTEEGEAEEDREEEGEEEEEEEEEGFLVN